MTQDTKCKRCGGQCYKGETYEYDGNDYCCAYCRDEVIFIERLTGK